MKLIRSTPPLSKQFRPTAVVIAVATLMASSAMTKAGTSYNGFGDVSYNKLGDLTIYQASTESNKPTLTLMLDKSGSMGGSVSFQEDETYRSSRVHRAYTRDCTRYWGNGSCREYGNYKYFHYHSSNDVPSNQTYEGYFTQDPYTAPELKGEGNQVCIMSYNSNSVYSDFYNPIAEYRNNVRLEYCLKGNERVYDRMSKLKLAIIELLNFKNVNEDIIMGVGAFGYTNSLGKVTVAAKPLDADQKERIYAFLRGLSPSGGTPMAPAFTDAGAYMLGTTTYSGGSTYSGMRSTADQSIAKNNKYIAPETQECGAKGVYLLTDGFPNGVSSQSSLTNMMGDALGTSSLSCPASGGLLQGSDGESRWQCMGEFAKQLRTKRQVTTAMVGFGSSFNVVDNPANYTSVERTIDRFKDANGNSYKYNKKYYDCSQIPTSNPDARNACNLGMESGKYDDVGGYGQGGFYFAKDTKDIVGSVLSVIQELKMDLPSTPAGTITVPQDPLNSLGVKPYAYLPMLEPKVGSDAAIWAGNLKKYNVKQGTLYGQGNKRLYIDEDGDGFPDDLNPDAQDIWSKRNETALNAAGASVNINNRITAGGFYAQLKTPKKSDNTSRNVYVESNNTLVKVGVSAGKLVGFDTLDNSYTTLKKLYLLSFLGYDASPTQAEADRIGTSAAKVKTEFEKIIANPPGDIKVLGGVIHSRPTLITYGANINAADKDSNNDGKVDADAGMVATDESSRDDYVMFGSMEGALHIASAETGQESFAFIPKTILDEQNGQIQALQPASTISNAPTFGVDAPWSVQGSYKYDFSAPTSQSSGKITAEQVYVYGGLRQGGKGLYGLDVSNLNAPRMLFSLNERTEGYQALGKAWSEPVTGRIRVGTGRNSIRDVIIFGGGYDECYEDPTFRLGVSDNKFSECNAKSMADGNAVYIADARTGAVLWSISGRDSGASGRHIKVPEMKHSVVGKITTLDRDDDGMIDHLYFADLGGQAFRVDLRNGQNISGSAGSNNFTRRIVRVLNASGDDKSDANSKTLLKQGLQPRFYGQPSVSFYKDSGVLFALINIASGDRSNPISRLRNTIPSQSDKLFGIIDRDIASQGLYAEDASVSLITKDLTISNLTEMPFNKVAGATKTSVQASMRPSVATKQGWYYPLNLFDGYNQVKNVKSMGDGLALGGLYYMTAYSPEMKYEETSGCAAQIVGGSERQIYCLPYGVCEQSDTTKADNSLNGTGGFIRAGKGIQELAFGAFDERNPTSRIMLGPQSFNELVSYNDRIGFDVGMTTGVSGIDTRCPGGNCSGSSVDKNKKNGNGSGNIDVNTMSYRLFNTRWYEQLAESIDE